MNYIILIGIFLLFGFLMPAVTGRMNAEENDNGDDERLGIFSDEDNVLDEDISK